jgi:hypothetical protein
MKREVKNAVKYLEKFEKTHPDQLTLFQGILDAGDEYSNTVALYDFIPKYFYGNSKRIDGKFLPTLEREFSYKDAITGREVQYNLKIFPARITTRLKGEKEKKDVDCYPGEREEFVEDALRKMACDPAHGCFLDDECGVVFTLYELQQELKKGGHNYNIDQIKEALLICARANIELSVKNNDGKSKVELSSGLFDTVGLATWDDWKKHGEHAKCFVRFNWIVTRAIKNGTFRPINWLKSMQIKQVITRHLFKRLSHHYTQASLEKGKEYTTLFSTMIRNFGVTLYKDARNNWRECKAALEALKASDVILSYEQENISDEKRSNKIADIKVTITPHPRFITEMKKFNAINKDVQQRMPEDVHRSRIEGQRQFLLQQGK